jgi:hypothetical protein
MKDVIDCGESVLKEQCGMTSRLSLLACTDVGEQPKYKNEPENILATLFITSNKSRQLPQQTSRRALYIYI